MLEASDADSVADYVVFNITTPPRAGEVQKKRRWERAGWLVNKFQQSDLYKVRNCNFTRHSYKRSVELFCNFRSKSLKPHLKIFFLFLL